MNIIIVSVSSDIGLGLARHWREQGHAVAGTFRTASGETQHLAALGVTMAHCDMDSVESMAKAAAHLVAAVGPWDLLVLAPGTMLPIGPFLECDMDEWAHSVSVNFVSVCRMAQMLLKNRNTDNPLGAMTVFFSGSGSNGTAPAYSAYTASKIACMKVCELLDTEIPDARFCILGPGWVKTKIHSETLRAGRELAGKSYDSTVERLKTEEFSTIGEIASVCDWVYSQPKNAVGGRNFSVVHDVFDERLVSALTANPDMYKLRRFGNDFAERQCSMTEHSPLFNEILELPSPVAECLIPSSAVYGAVKNAVIAEAARCFGDGASRPASFGQFGSLDFPFFSMGTINTTHLFGLDELILFNFYWKNRGKYKNFVDMGANVGLHSIVAGRCGYNVRSFEPDPIHYQKLRENLAANNIGSDAVQAAVSTSDGHAEFFRVKGNTTGSHLAGSKKDPYGELDRFDVEVVNAVPHMRWADLVKMDIEGHEAAVLCATDAQLWDATDVIVEISSAENAENVFRHMKSMGVGLFAQKIGWKAVNDIEDMPYSHRDGSLFISKKSGMPW